MAHAGLLAADHVFIPALNRAFSFQPITFAQYLIAIAMALTVIPIVELEKAVRRWTAKRER